MNIQTRSAYDLLIAHLKDVDLLCATKKLLTWDQETLLPPGGASASYRARQVAQLARMIHERMTDRRVDEWLSACEADGLLTADADGAAAVNVRETRRQYDRATKLPSRLVEEIARVSSESTHLWAEARKTNDYARFAPTLQRVIDLCREKAACYGHAPGGEPWDALADGYEPGCTAAQVEQLFTPLRPRLVRLVDQLLGSRHQPDDALHRLKLPKEQQRAFVTDVVCAIGFDFERGRLDESAHPFCLPLHRDDVRMTTRFADDMVHDALGSTMHEAGHGMYNQNVPGGEHVGTPMGDAVRLSIHESQSRMWENHVGRSLGFWRWCHPMLSRWFGSATAGLSLEQVYRSINLVQRQFIRVEADEATYNLHIMMRFDLERAMMRGDLTAGDLPGAWNEAFSHYLGLRVPDDRRGVMQDIHWAQAMIGYFPTYTLGNILAAQLYEAASRQLGDLEAQFAAGRFEGLRHWLIENVHSHGMRYRSAELCRVVTGEPPSVEPLMRHLEGKLKPIYGL